MPEEKPSPEPEGPPVPAKAERAERGGKKKDEEKEEPKAPRGPKKLEWVKEDFRYIVRMANTDLDGTRAVAISLTAIPGVGIRISEAVTDLAGVSRTERLGNLSEEQTDKIEATFGNLGEAFPHWMVNRPKDWATSLDLHLVGVDVEIRRRDDIILIKKIMVSLGTVRHPLRLKIVVIDTQIRLKQMLRDFIGIRVNRAKKSRMVNITSSVTRRESIGINAILHELSRL